MGGEQERTDEVQIDQAFLNQADQQYFQTIQRQMGELMDRLERFVDRRERVHDRELKKESLSQRKIHHISSYSNPSSKHFSKPYLSNSKPSLSSKTKPSIEPPFSNFFSESKPSSTKNLCHSISPSKSIQQPTQSPKIEPSKSKTLLLPSLTSETSPPIDKPSLFSKPFSEWDLDQIFKPQKSTSKTPKTPSKPSTTKTNQSLKQEAAIKEVICYPMEGRLCCGEVEEKNNVEGKEGEVELVEGVREEVEEIRGAVLEELSENESFEREEEGDKEETKIESPQTQEKPEGLIENSGNLSENPTNGEFLGNTLRVDTKESEWETQVLSGEEKESLDAINGEVRSCLFSNTLPSFVLKCWQEFKGACHDFTTLVSIEDKAKVIPRAVLNHEEKFGAMKTKLGSWRPYLSQDSRTNLLEEGEYDASMASSLPSLLSSNQVEPRGDMAKRAFIQKEDMFAKLSMFNSGPHYKPKPKCKFKSPTWHFVKRKSDDRIFHNKMTYFKEVLKPKGLTCSAIMRILDSLSYFGHNFCYTTRIDVIQEALER